MIKTENLKTKVNFGTGDVSVCSDNTRLILRDLKAPKKIGETITNSDDMNELPSIVMEFSSHESIDVVIRQLQLVRKQWMQLYGFALAC